MASPSINPPLCARCGKPVEGMSRTVWDFAYYHGDCYAEHSADCWLRYQKVSGISSYSHDERVTDGLELP